MRSIRWTPGRIMFALRHPALTRRHFKALAAPWPQ